MWVDTYGQKGSVVAKYVVVPKKQAAKQKQTDKCIGDAIPEIPKSVLGAL